MKCYLNLLDTMSIDGKLFINEFGVTMDRVLILLIPSLCSAGQFLDNPDLGNNSYLNARYLNHTLGRFITQDDKKQFNSLYAYGNGRVIKWSDPSGNMMNEDIEVEAVASVRSKSDGVTKEHVSAVAVKDDAHNILDKSNFIRPESTFSHVSTNRRKANEILSMSKSLEIESRQRLSGVYRGQMLEDRVSESTNILYTEYKQLRRKSFTTHLKPEERDRLKTFHDKLDTYNTPTNKAQIRVLSILNSKTYKEMTDELIRIYADGH